MSCSDFTLFSHGVMPPCCVINIQQAPGPQASHANVLYSTILVLPSTQIPSRAYAYAPLDSAFLGAHTPQYHSRCYPPDAPLRVAHPDLRGWRRRAYQLKRDLLIKDVANRVQSAFGMTSPPLCQSAAVAPLPFCPAKYGSALTPHRSASIQKGFNSFKSKKPRVV